MSENFLIQLSVIILFLPLLGFVVTLLLGKKIPKIFIFEVFVLFAGLVLSAILLFGKLTTFADTRIVSEIKWIDMGNVPVFGSINIYLGMLIDDISALMIVVVYIVSFLVHFFSVDYMNGDIRYNRYFAYLGLFTFSMSGIVLTHNMLMMYIFWELVGISSYLLIGFWYEKKSASDAGKKAFIVNRIGDLGMLAGLLLLFIRRIGGKAAEGTLGREKKIQNCPPERGGAHILAGK